MELKLLTLEQVRMVYRRDLCESFPPAELKPLEKIERLWDAGRYEPWGVWDGGEIVGECFLWLGTPGWMMIDYFCVAPVRRNGGLGAEILRRLALAKQDCVLFCETENPEDAPDPVMAKRRLLFYLRNGGRLAEYDAGAFGVQYKVIYWANRLVSASELAQQHSLVYSSSFSSAKYAKHVRIPLRPETELHPRDPLDE